MQANFDAPEGASSRVDPVNPRVKFFRHDARQLRRRDDAIEQQRERALQSGVLIEKHAHKAAAPENLQGVSKTFPAGKQLHAEALPGMLDEFVGRGVVEWTKDDPEFRKRRRHYERHRRLRLPIRKVW